MLEYSTTDFRRMSILQLNFLLSDTNFRGYIFGY